MAEGNDTVPISQSQNFNLNSCETESLQVLKPFPAPGVSLPKTNTDPGEKSRHGIFRVLAGISPGTPASIADPDMQMSNPLCTSAESNVTNAYQFHAGSGAIYSSDSLCNPARASSSGFHGNVFPGCSTATRLPFETGFNMAAPMNNSVFTMLFEQRNKGAI